MERDRLTAFSDGVIAVIITIMVLELHAPASTDLAALWPLTPVFLSYALSFISVAIYWNNHHHFFQLVPNVTGAVLWANLHLLFWLSLVPFATSWMGEHPLKAVPTAAYGVSLLLPALSWAMMQHVIISAQGPGSALKAAIGRDLKGRLAPLIYLTGIGLAFVAPLAADLAYAAVAAMWLVPDRRVERALKTAGRPG